MTIGDGVKRFENLAMKDEMTEDKDEKENGQETTVCISLRNISIFLNNYLLDKEQGKGSIGR